MRPTYAIIFLGLLSACTGKQIAETPTESADSVATIVESIDTALGSTKTAPKPPAPSDDKSFTSAEEAWNEGYYNGQQEGYTDAIHHLEYGYNYDDEPEYSGFLQTYVRGYEAGYDDGYNEGLEWNSEK